MVENIFSEARDEEIFETVVIVVSDANALSPAGMNQTGFGGHVGEGAVAIVLEKMPGGFLPRGKTFEAPAVYEENIQPTVVVVIVEGDTAAGGLEEISIFVFATENSFGVEAGLASNVDEADAQFARKCGRRRESCARGRWRGSC